MFSTYSNRHFSLSNNSKIDVLRKYAKDFVKAYESRKIVFSKDQNYLKV
jgi:hypothetical protein